MNRLQKKCLLATAGMHLLLIVILIVGPGFFSSKPKTDDTPILTIIPNVTTDKPFNSGQPTPQAPPPSPTPTSTPPTPQPVVTIPPPPPPDSTPQPPQPVQKPQPEDRDQPDEPVTHDAVVPVKHKPKPKHEPHPINVNLTPVHHRVPTTDTTTADSDAEQRREERARARAIARAARAIENNASASTQVTMPGTSSVSFANYGQMVRSIYDRAWTLPQNTSSDDADVTVNIVVASDGTVISAHIVSPSGDSSVDASVQRALDNVSNVGPFPDGSTEKQKSFTIKFNLQSKRQLG